MIQSLEETSDVELYNLSDDISEENNLALERIDKVIELSAELDKWRLAMDAPMPTYKPSPIPGPDT